MELRHQLARRRMIVFLGLLTFGYGLLMPDRHQLLIGLWAIVTSPTHLLTDFIAVGGLSATFANVAGHFFLAYILLSRQERLTISGLQFGAVGIFAGHAFFGTNLFNVLPVIAGMELYARFTKQSFRLYTTVSLLATAMAPMVSYLAFQGRISPWSVCLGVVTGLLLGFLVPALAEEFLKFHHGLTLYNYGFTTGLLTMFVLVLFPYFGLEIQSRQLISQGVHVYLLGYIGLLLLVLWGFLLRKLPTAMAGFPMLLKSTGRLPDDFVSKFGLYPTLLNMCLTTSVFAGMLVLFGVEFSGPILGGLLTILGFSAFGKHLRNTLPIGLGILLASLLLHQPINDTRFALALLFGTGLSPMAGFYGWFYGMLAGFFHYNLTAILLPLHQGLSLYNNGFSTGFVAAVLSPLINTLQDHKHLWKKRK